MEHAETSPLERETRAASERRAWAAVAVVAILATLLMAAQPVRTPDVWHHAAAGRLVVEQGGPAHEEVFSHTALGKRWIQYEWLAQLVIYASHATGGVDGFMLLRLLAICGAAGLLLMTAKRRGAGPCSAAVAVALAMCGMSNRFFTRPELFTWLCFGGLMLAVERLRSGGQRWLILPPLLLALWTNCHGAWIAGLAWYGLVCAGETLDWKLRRAHAVEARTLRLLWIGLALSFGATLLNPYGAHIWEVPFALSGSDRIARNIAEWQRPDLDFWLRPQHVGAYLTVMALLLAPRCARAGDWLVAAFFGVLSLTAVRHLALALLITAPILARQLSRIAVRSGLAARLRGARGRRLGVGLTALLCALLTALALEPPGFERFGWGLQPDTYPVGATEFLEENSLDGNLVNSYAFGNYLMWARYPENRIFIDGRVDMYGEEIVRLYDGMRTAQPGWRGVLRKMDVCAAVLETTRDPDRKLLQAMHAAPEWGLVYLDEISAVFANRARCYPEFWDSAYVYAVRPDGPDYAMIADPATRARAAQDYARLLAAEPGNIVALQGLADVADVEGDIEREIELLRRAAAVDPRHPGVRYNLGYSLLEAGRPEEAERHLRKTLALGEYEAQACSALGRLEKERGNPAAAVEWFRRATGHAPEDWRMWWNLSVALEEQGDLRGAIEALERVQALDPREVDPASRIESLREKIGKRI